MGRKACVTGFLKSEDDFLRAERNLKKYLQKIIDGKRHYVQEAYCILAKMKVWESERETIGRKKPFIFYEVQMRRGQRRYLDDFGRCGIDTKCAYVTAEEAVKKTRELINETNYDHSIFRVAEIYVDSKGNRKMTGEISCKKLNI